MQSTNYKAEQMLRQELGRGERLLWSGMPRQGLQLRSSDWYMVPFSLLWAGFAVFWEYSVVASRAPLFMILFGIPFVLVGIHMVIGRFFVESIQRSKTYYGVTDRRVLILSSLINRKTTSIALQNLGDVSLNERSDRSGSITFGAAASYPMWSWSGEWGHKAGPAFDTIDDVRRVYNVIQEAQRSELGRARAEG